MNAPLADGGYPFGHTVTLVYRIPDGHDLYGNDQYREVTHTVSGVAIGPGAEAEDAISARQHTTGTATAYLPLLEGVTAVDAIEIDGVRWELAGEPQFYRSPLTGWRPGLVVPLERTSG